MCFTTVCLSSSIRASLKDGCAGRWDGTKLYFTNLKLIFFL